MEHWKLPLAYDHGVNPRDYVVHVYGSTAVLNYRVSVHEQFTDADIISEQRVTEAYIKQNGSWLLIARQWGNLPVNFHKPVAVDTSVYKDYVGQYQWRPLDDVETISVKDGKLWSQFPKDEDEYLPLSSDTFFLKDDIGSVSTGYTAGADQGGRVLADKLLNRNHLLVYRRSGGYHLKRWWRARLPGYCYRWRVGRYSWVYLDDY